MQRTMMGILVGAGLVFLVSAALSKPETVLAYPAAAEGVGGNLIALTSQLSDGREQLTVIDPRLRVVGVYHINPTNGQLTLRSVRNINWDLRMTQFNGVSPLPQEIRSLLEQN